MDAAIHNFFQDRKEAWLKKNLKTSMDESESIALHEECEVLFSLEASLRY